MGFFLPSDARSSSSERVTGRFTAPVQRQRLPSFSNPQLLQFCVVVEVFFVCVSGGRGLLFSLEFMLSDQIRWVTSRSSRETDGQEFTKIIHISTYDVYTKAFSPQVKMFVQPITRLGVPELVSPRCEYFNIIVFIFPLFLPYLCVTLCWCFCFHTAQQNLICSRGLIPLQNCFICHDRFV